MIKESSVISGRRTRRLAGSWWGLAIWGFTSRIWSITDVLATRYFWAAKLYKESPSFTGTVLLAGPQPRPAGQGTARLGGAGSSLESFAARSAGGEGLRSASTGAGSGLPGSTAVGLASSEGARGAGFRSAAGGAVCFFPSPEGGVSPRESLGLPEKAVVGSGLLGFLRLGIIFGCLIRLRLIARESPSFQKGGRLDGKFGHEGLFGLLQAYPSQQDQDTTPTKARSE